MNDAAALGIFACLSNPTRLQILKTLVAAGPDGLIAGTIAQKIAASPSRASFHLSRMAEAGLLTAHRQAREITYAVDFSAMGALMRFLLQDCCADNPVVRACCVDAKAC
ncbi:MAG: helix-turn-helix transcriptional regulator [Pseudomonadota bacterium]